MRRIVALKSICRPHPLRRAYWLAHDVFQVKKNVFPHKTVILCADYKSSFDHLSMGKWVTPLKAIPYLYHNWSKDHPCTVRHFSDVCQLCPLRRTYCDIWNVFQAKKFKFCTWNMLKSHFPSFLLWCREIPTYLYLYYNENKGFSSAQLFRKILWEVLKGSFCSGAS